MTQSKVCDCGRGYRSAYDGKCGHCRTRADWKEHERLRNLPRTKIYAGIGSRETPDDIQVLMIQIGQELASMGWTLRSGHAQGADEAFEFGALKVPNASMEIFLPWKGFRNSPKQDPRYIAPEVSGEMIRVAKQFHPAWDRCTEAAKLLHARNGCQIAGLDMSIASDMVVCWTKGGRGGGGTGQALRLAAHLNLPIFDLAIPGTVDRLVTFVNSFN